MGHAFVVWPCTRKQMRLLEKLFGGVVHASGSLGVGVGKGNLTLWIWMICRHMGMRVGMIRRGSKMAILLAFAALSIPGIQTHPVGGVSPSSVISWMAVLRASIKSVRFIAVLSRLSFLLFQ